MDELDRQMLFPGYALHVHQTRGVGPRDILGPGGEMTVDLVNTHATAHGLLLDGKHTTEAATLVRTLGLYNLNAPDQFQEVNDLIIPGLMALGR
jgi:hypothetical protein